MRNCPVLPYLSASKDGIGSRSRWQHCHPSSVNRCVGRYVNTGSACRQNNVSECARCTGRSMRLGFKILISTRNVCNALPRNSVRSFTNGCAYAEVVRHSASYARLPSSSVADVGFLPLLPTWNRRRLAFLWRQFHYTDDCCPTAQSTASHERQYRRSL